MNPLSGLQLIIGGVVLAVIIALGIFIHHKGYEAGSREVQAEWDTYKIDQQNLVNEKLAARDAEILRQQAMNHQAELNHETLKAANADLAQRLARSLRDRLQAHISGHTLPASTGDSSQPADSAPGSSGASEAAELAGLTSDAVTACYADAAQLKALLETLN